MSQNQENSLQGFEFNGSVNQAATKKQKQLVKFIGIGAIAFSTLVGVGYGVKYMSDASDREIVAKGTQVLQSKVTQTELTSFLDDMRGQLTKSYSNASAALLGYASPDVKEVVDFTNNVNPTNFKEEVNRAYKLASDLLKEDKAIVERVHAKLQTPLQDDEKLKFFSSNDFKRFSTLNEFYKDKSKSDVLYQASSLDKVAKAIETDVAQIKEDRAALEDDAKKALAAMQKSGKSLKDVEKEFIVDNDKQLSAQLDELKALKAQGATVSDAQIAQLQAELALAKAEAAKKIAEDRAALEVAQAKLMNQAPAQQGAQPQQVVVHHDSGPSFGTLMMLYAWNNAMNNNSSSDAHYRASRAEDRAYEAERRADRAEAAVRRIESRGSYAYSQPKKMYSFGENSYLSNRMQQDGSLAKAQQAQKAGAKPDPFKFQPTAPATANIPKPAIQSQTQYGSVKQDNTQMKCIGVQCLNAIKQAKMDAQNQLAAKAEAQRMAERTRVENERKLQQMEQQRVKAAQQIEAQRAAAAQPAPAKKSIWDRSESKPPAPTQSSSFNKASSPPAPTRVAPPPPPPPRFSTPSRSSSFSSSSSSRKR